jgi:hypothetical protein
MKLLRHRRIMHSYTNETKRMNEHVSSLGLFESKLDLEFIKSYNEMIN